MPVKFTVGSRAGCTGVVINRCPRHGYVVPGVRDRFAVHGSALKSVLRCRCIAAAAIGTCRARAKYLTHDFTPGQIVAVIDRTDRIRVKKVAEVRTYKKRRTKIVLNDGSEWDTCGHRYSSSSMWDTGHIRPMDDELMARATDQRRRRDVEWALSKWDSLPEDVRRQIGELRRLVPCVNLKEAKDIVESPVPVVLTDIDAATAAAFRKYPAAPRACRSTSTRTKPVRPRCPRRST